MDGLSFEFFIELSETIKKVFPDEYKKLLMSEKIRSIMQELQECILDADNHSKESEV